MQPLVLIGCIIFIILQTTWADPFVGPPVLTSTGGVLDVALDAIEATIFVGSLSDTRELYNATLNPPVFRLTQGDTFKLTLTNVLTSMTNTNIHWHGLAIAPVTGADNIFDEVAPNDTYIYNFQIPANHPVGTFWYHSHAMFVSEAQVYQGMSGVFLIDPPTGAVVDRFPQLAGKQERIFPLRELVFGNPRVQLLNLQQNPTITIAPGDAEYWRFANIAANNRYTISFPTGLSVVRVASDGHYLVAALPLASLTLVPGGRADVIVRADTAGTYQLTSDEENMFGQATGVPARLVIVEVSGAAVTPPVQLPSALAEQVDLRDMSLTRKRRLEVCCYFFFSF